MRIALFGAPGVGKGSQAALLNKNQGLAHISTGIILRDAIRNRTPVGLEAEGYMNASQLVPGAIVRVLAEEAIAEHKFDRFVLDGYPRTIEQADWLSEFLSENKAGLRCVVNLVVSDELIVRRLSQRRVNLETGENYHLKFKPPPVDIDPDIIIQRDDDKPEAIKLRLNVYREETHPVVAFYEARNLIVEVNGTGGFEDVHARIIEAVYSFAPTQ